MRSSSCVFLVLSLSTAAVSVSAQATPAQRFDNATAGIALTRPSGWHTASLQSVQENRSLVQLSDSELHAAFQELATAPLFVFMKYPEPHPTVNPTIQVGLHPTGSLKGSAPADILRLAVGTMQRALEGFTFVSPIQDTQVSGVPAAYLRSRYTLKTTTGQQAPVLSRLWVVPRGAYMFLIGMSGPPDGPDVSESEFAQVLRSITIER